MGLGYATLDLFFYVIFFIKSLSEGQFSPDFPCMIYFIPLSYFDQGFIAQISNESSMGLNGNSLLKESKHVL